MVMLAPGLPSLPHPSTGLSSAADLPSATDLIAASWLAVSPTVRELGSFGGLLAGFAVSPVSLLVWGANQLLPLSRRLEQGTPRHCSHVESGPAAEKVLSVCHRRTLLLQSSLNPSFRVLLAKTSDPYLLEEFFLIVQEQPAVQIAPSPFVFYS